jgi:hypothetical protein
MLARLRKGPLDLLRSLRGGYPSKPARSIGQARQFVLDAGYGGPYHWIIGVALAAQACGTTL